jgi:hypothetical protein
MIVCRRERSWSAARDTPDVEASIAIAISILAVDRSRRLCRRGIGVLARNGKQFARGTGEADR